jgi:pimeloyl-ACP methyl ester carboxylesterase
MTASHQTRAQIPEHLEHRISAPDGRTIAVAEWGDPNGVPVFSFHGTPGGRIGWFYREPGISARLGIRRITVDRPGYGESTRQPGRRVGDFPADVATIADALGIDRFAVSGGSGGGPHVLACAAMLGDRVLRCLAAVSITPYVGIDFDWLAGMTQGNIDEFNAALEGETALRALLERERTTTLDRLAAGNTDFLGDTYEMADADRAQMAKSFAVSAAHLMDCLQPGVDGWVDDDIAFTKPWGFEVESISVPVYLTYGRADTLVPAAHGDWLAAHIPHAEVHVTDVGHMGDDDDIERELSWLAGRA